MEEEAPTIVQFIKKCGKIITMPYKEEGSDEMKDLKYFGLVLIALALAWFFSGGYDRYRASYYDATTTPQTSVYIAK